MTKRQAGGSSTVTTASGECSAIHGRIEGRFSRTALVHAARSPFLGVFFTFDFAGATVFGTFGSRPSFRQSASTSALHVLVELLQLGELGGLFGRRDRAAHRCRRRG